MKEKILKHLPGFIAGIVLASICLLVYQNYTTGKRINALMNNDGLISNFLEAATQGQFSAYLKTNTKTQ